MDGYYGSEVDDLVVPRDHDSLDSFLLPDNWLPLGITAPEKFTSYNKFVIKGTNSTEEELNFDADVDICGQDGVYSSDSSVLMEGSPQRMLPLGRTDFQLNDMSELDQMDDFFLSSIFEEDMIGMNNINGSFGYSSESKYNMMQDDNLFTDVKLGSQHNSGHFTGMGSSKYLKTHAFSPSVDWEEGEVEEPSRNFFNRKQETNSPGKAPVVRVLVPSGQNSRSGHVGVETSFEECVLQELESVMAQLTETTRICFRDALYRLAENSKQHAGNGRQNGDICEKPSPLMDHDETSSLGKSMAPESETNTIDRAIANLMFNKIDTSAQNTTPTAPMTFKREVIGSARSFDYTKDYKKEDLDISHCAHSTSSEADAEVPVFQHDNHLEMDFSSSMLNML